MARVAQADQVLIVAVAHIAIIVIDLGCGSTTATTYPQIAVEDDLSEFIPVVAVAAKRGGRPVVDSATFGQRLVDRAAARHGGEQ
jgi:hypothetical protein